MLFGAICTVSALAALVPSVSAERFESTIGEKILACDAIVVGRVARVEASSQTFGQYAWDTVLSRISVEKALEGGIAPGESIVVSDIPACLKIEAIDTIERKYLLLLNRQKAGDLRAIQAIDVTSWQVEAAIVPWVSALAATKSADREQDDDTYFDWSLDGAESAYIGAFAVSDLYRSISLRARELDGGRSIRLQATLSRLLLEARSETLRIVDILAQKRDPQIIAYLITSLYDPSIATSDYAWLFMRNVANYYDWRSGAILAEEAQTQDVDVRLDRVSAFLERLTACPEFLIPADGAFHAYVVEADVEVRDLERSQREAIGEVESEGNFVYESDEPIVDIVWARVNISVTKEEEDLIPGNEASEDEWDDNE